MGINTIVKLNSGGPPMVILDETHTKYMCKWNGGHSWFPKVCVKLY